MNALDFIVLFLVALAGLNGWRRGLIHTVFRLVSFALSLVLALFLYPHMAAFLRGTPLFTFLKNSINNALGLDALAANAAARGMSLIDALPLPQVVRETLHVNNNPEMNTTLGTFGVQEYIAGFFANMIIVALSIIILFLLFFVLISLAGVLMDIVSSLPIIHTFNNLGGLLFGVILGVACTGLAVFVMSLLSGSSESISNWLYGSYFAGWVLRVMSGLVF